MSIICLKNFLIFHKKNGFLTVFFIPFLSLMVLSFFGFFLLCLGIKNFTKAQTACIKINLKGQAHLGKIMKKLLNLNKTSRNLQNRKTSIQASMTAAALIGNLKALSLLKKALNLVKFKQSLLLVRQKGLLAKGQWIKVKTLKKFRRSLSGLKAYSIHEPTFFKKALAVKKTKIGNNAFIYSPTENFSKKQSTVFSWKMNLFTHSGIKRITIPGFPLHHSENFHCTATLERDQNIWRAKLSF